LTIWIIPSYLQNFVGVSYVFRISDCRCNLWPSISASESSWGLVALVRKLVNTKVIAKWVKVEYVCLVV
jgi:hypothetical protein